MLLGTLSNDDDDGSENVAKKLNSFKNCVLSNLLASIWTRSICQMQATFPGVEFLRILFRFKKRKENSSSYVHVLHKTSNQEVSRRSRAVDVKEKSCTKKRDARAELLLWSLNLLFVEVVVVVVVA